MVSSITSLTKSGLKDWFIQRVSAVILAIYVLFLLGFVIGNAPVTYVSWSMLFANTWMKFFTVLALLSLIAHAWIGVWTILTDYVKVASVRVLIQLIVILAFIGYVYWVIQILWG